MEGKGNNGLIYFVTGCAIGAALGVLFAPKSGKETREELGEWIKERRDKSKDLIAKMKEEAIAKKDQVASAIKAGRQAYAEAAHNNG